MGEATKYLPLLAGRNLYILLEDEKLSGADALNRALRPYWPSLWKLAARGHYYVKHEPIREAPKISRGAASSHRFLPSRRRDLPCPSRAVTATIFRCF